MLIKRVIFFIELFLFALSVAGMIVSPGIIFGGNKVDFSSVQYPQEIFDFVVNLLVIIGLYGFAFNKIIFNKPVWLIVLFAVALKIILLDFDFSEVNSFESMAFLLLFLGWKLIVLTALGLYMQFTGKAKVR